MNGNGKRVLVVDDDARAGLLLSSLLEHANYNVLQVYHGLDALTELNKRRFDVVITDYSMASTQAMELMKRIRARGLETPVILVSDMQPNISPVDERLQPFVWLRKPYERRALLDLVSAATSVAAHSGKAFAFATAMSR
jgi:DNA-binding NtrC family response regulator